MQNNFPRTKNEAPGPLYPTPMLGSLVPMVPLPGVAASALESYSRFLVSGRARGIKIELERERDSADKKGQSLRLVPF